MKIDSVENVRKLRPCLVSMQKKKKLFTLSYQMFKHMHEVLNIDKKNTNYTDCV
jgi:hypothetical protein